jgi:aminoglycoside phosphotransferase (APT) family kinase protein
MSGPVVGINEPEVSVWMAEHVGSVGACTFELIAGGRSNLTFRVTDERGRPFALRRPPTSHVLPTAHDMVREFTFISGVRPFAIPVPEPLALCTDESVNERPFYVMEFVDGEILRSRQDAERAYGEGDRRLIGEHLAATLAALHEVDIEAAGLSALARHDGYIERQLKRWRGQYEQMAVAGVDHGGVVEAVADELAARVPPQQRVAIVHGDYRLDNVVLDRAGYVKAILDWEICTLGDPMADLGMLLVYWADTADALSPLVGLGPTTAAGMATRAEVLKAYEQASGLAVSNVGYYQAFGYWKLACIMQGVYARYIGGATAGDRGSVDDYPRHILSLAETARTALAGA